MTPQPDIRTCMTLLGQIKDPKVRYYWLKLGEVLATAALPLETEAPKAPRKRRKAVS